MTARPHHLTLRVVVPPFGTRQGAVECRPVVDGEDILAGVFEKGPAEDPGRLLGPDSPLLATAAPRRVRLAEAECTEGCCGAVYVTVRREGRQVVRSDWRNPDKRSFSLPELRFATDQYEAEVHRASRDHSWEWRGPDGRQAPGGAAPGARRPSAGVQRADHLAGRASISSGVNSTPPPGNRSSTVGR